MQVVNSTNVCYCVEMHVVLIIFLNAWFGLDC